MVSNGNEKRKKHIANNTRLHIVDWNFRFRGLPRHFGRNEIRTGRYWISNIGGIMASSVKDSNYIVIQGWAVAQLKLKNNNLLVYSIIYGFSQDGVNEYTGGLKYLTDWCNCSKQCIIKCLQSLCAKQLIIKTETVKNNIKNCSYRANLDILTRFNGGKQSLMGGKQSLTPGGKQSLPNNIYSDNILKNKYKEKKDESVLDKFPCLKEGLLNG